MTPEEYEERYEKARRAWHSLTPRQRKQVQNMMEVIMYSANFNEPETRRAWKEKQK